jgi:hypothetical protein
VKVRVFPAAAILVFVVAAGMGRAQSAEPLSKVEEGKTLRLPRPGERLLVRIEDDGRPWALSEASRPAPGVVQGAAAVVFEPDVETLTAPPNDTCAGAFGISGTGDFAFDNGMATADGVQTHFACNFFGEMAIAKDVWFRWTAPVTARFIAETCTGTAFDSKIAVYNTTTCTPGTPTLLGCNDDACSVQSRVGFNATAGQAYLIRVGSFPSDPGGPGLLHIAFEAGQTVCQFGTGSCQTRDVSDAFDATGHAIFDDFTPAMSGSITGLCWWGAYFNGIGDCEFGSTDQFYIRYYQDPPLGEPPSELIAEFQPGQFPVVGPVPTGGFINEVFPEYAYRMTHPPVPVLAGNCYWVSIENRLPAPPLGNCAWYWERAGGANMISYFDEVRVDEDFAFCVNLPLAAPGACETAMAPANDTCANAQPISCNSTVTGQDNLFATTSVDDPPYSCRSGGSAQGIGTLWYRFVAIGTTARISLCGNEVGDTLLGVYSGACGSLTQIACSDDFCAFKSQVCVSGLVPGQTYRIQLASYDNANRRNYDLSVLCPCPAAPANDECTTAALLTTPTTSTPAVASGNTANATPEALGTPACGFSLVSAPGLWYRVAGNGRTYTASLCGAAFDTKISVFCGACAQPICVASNDDDCGTASEVEWCTAGGETYYVLVHGFNGAVGPFTLTVSTSATTCTPPPNCATCAYACPAGSVAENELCGEDKNGGCNATPIAVQGLQCGQTVCGTMSTFGVTRDTDWYQFSITLPSVVTWSVQSESPVEAILVNTTCPPTVLASGTTARCGTATATALLQPGTYRSFVGAVFDGYPCGGANDYVATLQCGAVGACCLGGDCFRVPASQCTAMGGQYAADGTACPINYVMTNCANGFEDIAATGQQAVLGDNDGVSVPIVFPFRFYGVASSTVSISSNGYLTFDASVGDATNDPIPNPVAPNAIIAPLWDDFSPNSAGTIHVVTLGLTPNRRLIVQWKNVPQFLMNDSNTFQVVLFEGSNCIEFRYGVFTAQSPAGDYSVGVENHAGASGTSVDAATLTPGACRRFCPTLAPGGCPAITPCPGDANGDRVVSFADITTVLTFWGFPGPMGDATHDGVVNFADVTRVLQHWGNACP